MRNLFGRQIGAGIICALTLISFQGCTKIAFPTLSSPTTINHPSELNGTYSNRSLDTSILNNTLWAVFARKAGKYEFSPDYNQFNLTVKLEAKGERKINAQLYQGAVLIDERQLRGSVESLKSFRIKQRTHNPGVPFIYMKLSRYAYRLRKNESGQLLVDVVDSHGKMIFILAGGNTDNYTFSYLRE